MTSLLSKVNLIFTLIFFLISFPAISHNGPAPFPASYGPIVHPAVVKTTELEFGCDTFVFSIPCQRSEKVELSLEKEFWAYVQNRDAEKMKTLINRMKGYAFSSRSEYAPRLYRLIGFGYMVRAQQSASITLSSAPNILMARVYAQKSDTSQPNNSHSVALRSFIDTVFPYVIGWGGLGDNIVNRMIAMPDQFGLPGYEGTISGAMSLAYTRDPERIRRGLEIMNNCQDLVCQRTSSLGPFKEVGVMWTAAEAHIALGEPEKAKQAFEQAKAFAIENGLPKGLFEELEKVEQEVLYGQYAEETPKLKGLGLYRLPASPSQTNLSCAMCHAGAQVPDHYYSWK